MKSKILALFALTGFMTVGLFSGHKNAQNNSNNNEPVIKVNKTSKVIGSAVDTYYKSITDDMSGATLRKALENLCYGSFKKEPTSLSYGSVKNYFAGAYRSPTDSSAMVLYYTDKSSKQYSWNKEHIWPNSRGTGDGSGPCGDPWVIAPCDSGDNSGRGNNVYGLVSGSYDPGTGADGALLKYRGIAARAILYTATTWWHHPGKNSNPLELDDTTAYSPGANKMGILSQLLEWNLQYPIDETETIRNEYIYSALGVRNPFVDHREYGCKIWGDTNDKTRAICAGQYTPDDGGGSSQEDETKPDTPIDNPETNKEYRLGVYQEALKEQYYITGEISNVKYADTIRVKKDSAKVQLISQGNGYNLKVTKKNGSTVYLNGKLEDDKPGISFDSTASTVWTFNTSYKTLQTTMGSNNYFLNAYNSFSTISLSKTSYLGNSTTYSAHLYDLNSLPPSDDGGSSQSDEDSKPKGGGGCHASIEGNSSIVFISSTILLFFAIKQAIKARKRKEND